MCSIVMGLQTAQTELGLNQFINLESAIRKTLTYARFDTGSQAMVEAVEPMKTAKMRAPQ
jgi:hypothetical protein